MSNKKVRKALILIMVVAMFVSGLGMGLSMLVAN